MCDGEKRGSAAHCGKAAGGAAVKLQLRWTASADYFEVAPEHLLRVSRAEGLHAGFLGGKSSREVDRRRSPTGAVCDFTVGEDAAHESFAVSVEELGDARNLGDVEAKTDDVRHV